ALAEYRLDRLGHRGGGLATADDVEVPVAREVVLLLVHSEDRTGELEMGANRGARLGRGQGRLDPVQGQRAAALSFRLALGKVDRHGIGFDRFAPRPVRQTGVTSGLRIVRIKIAVPEPVARDRSATRGLHLAPYRERPVVRLEMARRQSR